MPQRPVKPLNSILVSGNPIYEEYEVETATTMYPGTLVIKGSDSRYVVTGTDNSTEIIGVLDIMPDQKLTTMTSTPTTYSVGDQVRVIRGDCVVQLRALHSATITIGLKVQCAGAGRIDQYATANADVGIAEEDFGPAAADGWVIVKLTNV